ncbi:hypothetical protein ACIOEX_11020 [Streptomyces sp. NPDC087850]|uniref:hypothetical protein n=1 Tax=Streptomyces sp. NPDC087850 TaxID=3365809 RepID=UPI003818F918
MADPEINTAAAVPADFLPRPAGPRWEVVRITAPLGLDAISRCCRRTVLGPVWITPARRTIEIVVAPGTVPLWPAGLRGTVCAVADKTAPGSRGRRWIVAPSPDRPAATDAYALAEAVTDALVRRALTCLTRKAGDPS